MNNCKICKAEIDKINSFVLTDAYKKYRKRQKIKIEKKPLEIAPVREFSPEYKEQF